MHGDREGECREGSISRAYRKDRQKLIMDDVIWSTGYRVDEMLKCLGSSPSLRKLRRFAVECARRVLPKSPDDVMTQALEVADNFANHAATKRELARARATLQETHEQRHAQWFPLYSGHIRSVPAWHATREQIVRGARECANCCAWSSTRMHNEHFGVHMTVPVEEWTGQAFLLRDIFGNPFRPITLDPRWLTSTVVDLAQAIYNERAFDRMPILSDALMDAGCDSEDIILHCRGDGPHVRGCWVVDLLLGKE